MGPASKAVAGASRERLRKTPGTEVEVKLRVADRKAVLRSLRKLKANGGPRMHEMNTLYDTPAGTLAREGKLVRVRVTTLVASPGAGKPAGRPGRTASRQPAVLTYKGPVQNGGAAAKSHSSRYKIREEHELRLEDASALAHVLERMGLRPWFRYEKYRTTYWLPGVAGLLVELDETPIGDFLELEGDSAAIDRGASILGYSVSDYITKSYGQLFVEQRRRAKRSGSSSGDLPFAEGPAHMLFLPRK